MTAGSSARRIQGPQRSSSGPLPMPYHSNAGRPGTCASSVVWLNICSGSTAFHTSHNRISRELGTLLRVGHYPVKGRELTPTNIGFCASMKLAEGFCRMGNGLKYALKEYRSAQGLRPKEPDFRMVLKNLSHRLKIRRQESKLAFVNDAGSV